MDKILYLMAGGSLGTLLRYGFSVWAQGRFGEFLPYGTLMANLLGCFLIGALYVIAEETRVFSAGIRLMIFTGFLGALTTFSTFELESFLLAKEGAFGRMLLYIGGSIALGLFLLWAGHATARSFLPESSSL